MISNSGRKRLLIFAVLAIGTISACGGVGHGGGADVTGPPTVDELANATFVGLFDHPVQLIDGRWEGEPFVAGGASRPSAGLVDHFSLIGDLDGDKSAETVVLLWESQGGSGTRDYLAVTSRKMNGVGNIATALVGDRVQVKSGWIAEGRITLDVIRAGPEDAACCPTERARIVWTLNEDGLEQTAEEVVGTLSLSDLEGPEWVLEELDRGRPVPDGVEIGLSFADDKVTGSGGCNRYFATISSEGPGNLSFAGMGSTMMACPEPAMEAEQRYLKTLAGASSYGFLGGWLVIGCETEDGHATLVFSPQNSSRNDGSG
jgi:heat shock protein HslJ